MDKPFKTIAEQVKILESRGLATDALTSQILEREGYYQVVNGYRDPFLDPAATEAAGEDRYRPGTSFADLYRLFSFDRGLRDALMESFAKAEATLKAVCAHRFTEAHQDEVNPYLSEQNYSEAAQADGSARNLIAELEKAIGLRHGETRWRRKSYLVHYVQDHDGESLRSLLRGVARDLPAVSDALLTSMEVEDIDALFPVAP